MGEIVGNGDVGSMVEVAPVASQEAGSTSLSTQAAPELNFAEVESIVRENLGQAVKIMERVPAGTELPVSKFTPKGETLEIKFDPAISLSVRANTDNESLMVQAYNIGLQAVHRAKSIQELAGLAAMLKSIFKDKLPDSQKSFIDERFEAEAKLVANESFPDDAEFMNDLEDQFLIAQDQAIVDNLQTEMKQIDLAITTLGAIFLGSTDFSVPLEKFHQSIEEILEQLSTVADTKLAYAENSETVSSKVRSLRTDLLDKYKLTFTRERLASYPYPLPSDILESELFFLNTLQENGRITPAESSDLSTYLGGEVAELMNKRTRESVKALVPEEPVAV